MKLFSGLDYLKIDVANNFGFDKLQFEERIKWFNANINIMKDTTDAEIFEMSTHSTEAPALAYGGMLAYRDSIKDIPTGYKVGLDACCSG